MIPAQTLVNFPIFADGGSKVPPEEAKYSEGYVPADVLPAQHANWFFNKTSDAITELNSYAQSAGAELRNIVTAGGASPSADSDNQVITAIQYLIAKAKAEAILAAHPVGSLYWTDKNEDPSVTFGGGTWKRLKDVFILNAGDTYANQATGGAATVTLTTEQLPSHSHSFTGTAVTSGTESQGHTHKVTAAGSISSHTHTMRHTHSVTAAGSISGHTHTISHTHKVTAAGSVSEHTHSISHTHTVTASGTISGGSYTFTGTANQSTGNQSANHTHTFTTGGMSANETGSYTPYIGGNKNGQSVGDAGSDFAGNISLTGSISGKTLTNTSSNFTHYKTLSINVAHTHSGTTANQSANHSHTYTAAGTIAVSTNPTFTGSSVSTNKASSETSGSATPTFTGSEVDTGSASSTNSGSTTPTFTGSAVNTGNTDANTGGTAPTFTGSEVTSGGTSQTHTHSVTAAGTNSNTGGGNAHNNMPPYLAKYCWERTA